MTWQGTKGGSSTDVDATRPTDIQREHLLKHNYGKYKILKKIQQGATGKMMARLEAVAQVVD